MPPSGTAPTQGRDGAKPRAGAQGRREPHPQRLGDRQSPAQQGLGAEGGHQPGKAAEGAGGRGGGETGPRRNRRWLRKRSRYAGPCRGQCNSWPLARIWRVKPNLSRPQFCANLLAFKVNFSAASSLLVALASKGGCVGTGRVGS